ncbi:flagellar filament capping protein FliD [Desulfobacula phenolica]|uniref:Flagellar hook-associated protein 2 n=1 Tax=Desulfobacula phenolica TaxID=90732 RepID=A0A1H2DSC6_9BACT|nr:flagellar filament capping protein FliD [Desulfobacula phenolica]SDT85694.1 flagellar hook-associated protein 2 [Desulfobacula phenolica]
MATGSITSLGIGSGLDLQDILDQLKGVDESRITAKENKKIQFQNQVDAYNTVNAKLFSIKSDALNLSLSSNFLDNSVSVTDEDILSATVGDGYDASSYSVDVTQKAQRNSWASTGVSSRTEAMFAEPESGITDHDTMAAISQDKTLTLNYGTYEGISTENSIAAGTTDATFAINGVNIGAVVISDNDSDDTLVNAINAKSDEHGVTASVDEDGMLTLMSADHSDIEVTMEGETLDVFGGTGNMINTGQEQIDISLTAGMTFSEIADKINTSSSNKDANGNQLVNASFTRGDDGDYYIRLSAISGGNTADSEINVAGLDAAGEFEWLAADKTVAIAQNEATMYLSVPPGTTYEEMANLINSSEDNPGITAAMIDNGDSTNPYQFTLTSDDTGEDARISLSNLAGLAEVTGAEGESLNAEFAVNGILYSRQSNTSIDDVITGVTFDLKNTGESTLNIEVNHDTVKEDIMSMIEGFNDIISYIKGTETDEEAADTEDTTKEDTDNPLDGSSSANRIVYQLKSLLTTVLDLDTGYTSLSNIGLEISSNGTFSMDEDALDEAIASDPDSLKELFLGNTDKEITGLADIINNAVTDMVSSTGIAETEIDEAESKITRIDKDIETETQRLTKKYETMAKEFARLDTYISQLNSQAGALTSMIDAFSKANEK